MYLRKSCNARKNSVCNKYRPFPPTTSSKIYESACESELMYGLECWSLTDTIIAILEATNYQCASLLQG